MADGDLPKPDDRDARARAALLAAFADPDVRVALSEHTLLEFSGVLTQRVGMGEFPDCTEDWYERSFGAVMGAIANGDIEIVPVPPKAAEHAIVLRRIATRDYGIAFRVWDALHLITATGWADALQLSVELWTADSDFRRFLDHFSYFEAYVTLLLLR
jgi:hypothetical protein